MTAADLAYQLERSEDCTAQSLRQLAATLSPSRAEMLERCAIVAGLYPLPASSCSWNFAVTNDADEEGLSFTGYGPAQASPRRCRIKRKPNMFVTRAEAPALRCARHRADVDRQRDWIVERLGFDHVRHRGSV